MAIDSNGKLMIKVGLVFDTRQAFKNAKQSMAELQALINADRKKVSADLDNIKAEEKKKKAVDNTTKSLKSQKSMLENMTATIKNTVANFLKFTIISSVFMAVTQTMRATISLMIELDTAYTNFAIVTRATATEIVAVDKRISELTTTLGRMKSEVVNAVTEFARAGYTIDESMTLAENAMMGANVGAVELADVVTYLIAGMRAFNYEAGESARILDVLFKVANATAIDLEGIGEAFLRSANTLKLAGATLEQASALIAGANESVQDPAKVGTALKTIASRLRGVSEEGEIVPTLEKDFKKLGIEIRDSEGQFRNIYDIFKELSVAIKTVDDLTKESILEKLAGKRQKNILVGLLNDFDIVEMSLEKGLSSFGEVALAQEDSINSVQGRINLLKVAVQELFQTLSDPSGFKIFIDGLTGLVKIFNGFAKIVNDIPDWIKIISGLGLALVGLAGQTVTYVGAIGGVLLAFNPWLVAIGAGISLLTAFSIAGEQSAESQAQLRKELEATTKIQQEFTKGFLESGEENQKKTAQAIRDTIQELKSLTEQQKAYEEATREVGNTGVSRDSGGLKDQTKAISEARAELEKYGFTSETATKWMEEYGDAVLRVKDAQEILRDRLKETNDEINSITEDTQILVSAKEQLEEQGAIELNTLEKLLASHPEYAKVLGEDSKAQGILLDSIIKTNKDGLISSQQTILTEIEIAKQRIETIKTQAKAFLGLGKIIAWVNSDMSQGFSNFVNSGVSKEIADLELQIENLEIASALYTNGIKLQDAVRDSSGKKAKEVLTAEQNALEEINYLIELKQKLISQTEDGSDEQAKAQYELIALYEKQKVALMAVKNSLNKTKLGADEYANQVRDLSLKIEDANVSIYNLNKQLLESKIAFEKASLEKTSKSIAKAISEQIKEVEKLRNEEEERYKRAIESKEDEIDAQQKLNDSIEDRLELEKALLDLQKLREERENILSEKNVRRVENADVGFTNIADPRELQRINEEIAKAEENVADIKREQQQALVIDRLEAQKEALEKERDAELEAFDDRLEKLGEFESEVNEAIAEGNAIQVGLVNSIQNQLASLEGLSYAGRLESLRYFVDQYNKTLASMASNTAKVSSLSSGGSTSSSASTSTGKPSTGGTSSSKSGTTVAGSTTATKSVTQSVVKDKYGSEPQGTTINFNNPKIVTPNPTKVFQNFNNTIRGKSVE